MQKKQPPATGGAGAVHRVTALLGIVLAIEQEVRAKASK
jgi:hypothetical protein